MKLEEALKQNRPIKRKEWGDAKWISPMYGSVCISFQDSQATDWVIEPHPCTHEAESVRLNGSYYYTDSCKHCDAQIKSVGWESV